MRAFVQRCKGRTAIVSQLADGSRKENHFEGPGLVVLLGWINSDGQRADLAAAEDWLYSKVVGLRVFPDPEGRMNLSLADFAKTNAGKGGILWVPQFTLAGSLDKGFRPSFTNALSPDAARVRFESWLRRFQGDAEISHIHGHFGADMDLSFTNWGPVSLLLEK